MITGEIKNRIDRIWEIFWTGGITNPLEVIEQFTYLLFIKQLDDFETIAEERSEAAAAGRRGIFNKKTKHLRWSSFKETDAEQMYGIVANEVFPFIRKLHPNEASAYSRFMGDAVFKIPSPLILSKIVAAVDKLDLMEQDSKGDLYEYLLSKLAASGTNGQFRTPRHIIQMMVELIKPTPDDIIADPAMGTAGFLVAAQDYLRKHYPEIECDPKLTGHFNNSMFHGFDIDRTMLRIGAMNMLLHGIENPEIEYRNSLSVHDTEEGRYTLILANPPFKGALDYEAVDPELEKTVKTKKTELLFLLLNIKMLKVGGRSAIILPDGVLFGRSNAHLQVRKEIIEKHKLEAIISMPAGVFRPYAGISTAVMIFTKTCTGGTDRVWFYDMKADGYSLDDRRQPVRENDIPDLLSRYERLEQEADRNRSEQSFFVPLEEIRENGYDLSVNTYKEIPREKVQSIRPEEILGQIQELEKKISEGLKELSDMLEEYQ